MDISTSKQKELVWVQVLYLYVVPVLLIYYGIVPPAFRFLLLLCVALLLLGIIKRDSWTYADMGVQRAYMRDIVPYSLFTLGGVGFIVWLGQVVPHAPFYGWWENAKFLLLFIPISVLQEVIFRGVLMNMLRRAFMSPVFVILMNAAVFALIHVIYLNSTFVLPLTFIGGIGFAWMYYQYPNLILISISHTILNFTAMILGFFVIR